MIFIYSSKPSLSVVNLEISASNHFLKIDLRFFHFLRLDYVCVAYRKYIIILSLVESIKNRKPIKEIFSVSFEQLDLGLFKIY